MVAHYLVRPRRLAEPGDHATVVYFLAETRPPMPDSNASLILGNLSELTAHPWSESDLRDLSEAFGAIARKGNVRILPEEIRSIALEGLWGIRSVLYALREGRLRFSREQWVEDIRKYRLDHLLSTTWENARGDWVPWYALDVRGLEAVEVEVRERILGHVGYRWSWQVQGYELRGTTIPLSFEYRSVRETIGYLARLFSHFPSRYREAVRQVPTSEGTSQQASGARADVLENLAGPLADQPEGLHQFDALRREVLSFLKAQSAADEQLLCAHWFDGIAPTSNRDRLSVIRLTARFADQLLEKGWEVESLLNIGTARMPGAGKLNRGKRNRESAALDIAKKRAAILEGEEELRWRVGGFLRHCNASPECVARLRLRSAIEVASSAGPARRVIPIPEHTFTGTSRTKSFHAWRELDPRVRDCILEVIQRIDGDVAAVVSAEPFTPEIRESWKSVLEARCTLAEAQDELRRMVRKHGGQR